MVDFRVIRLIYTKSYNILISTINMEIFSYLLVSKLAKTLYYFLFALLFCIILIHPSLLLYSTPFLFFLPIHTSVLPKINQLKASRMLWTLMRSYFHLLYAKANKI